MTFFSVIIPTYNRAHLVIEAIDSVLSQSYSHFEVIVVDDGSTDNTEQVIRDRYFSHQKLIYFKKQHEERGVARNFALKHAKGDYAVFLDSDDLMKPHYLQTLNNIIVEHPQVKLLAAKYSFDKSGKSHPFLQDLAEGWYDQSLFLRGSILGCNFCIKIKDHPFKLFHGDMVLAFTEDWLFLLENLADNKIFIKDEICIIMREHEGRSIHNNRKVIEARRKATDWILRNLKFSPANRRTLIAWSHHFCGVHEYLDYKRKPALNEAMAALKEIIFQKHFWLLFVKSIVGRKLIKAIR
jgi:glycosyltransferase involved in cell wall biosynthesis